MSSARIHQLLRPIAEEGHSYTCKLPPDAPLGDSPEAPFSSRLELFEDGRPLGPPHSQHQEIRALGNGRFSHWHQHVYFSTSDNTDPRGNGRRYDIYLPDPADEPALGALAGLFKHGRAAQNEWDAYAAAEALFYEVCPTVFLGDFAKTCWHDKAFVDDYLRLVPGNRRSFERKYAVAQLVRGLKHVPGDLAECGVYNGATAYFMAKATEAVGIPRPLHLFDSFAGLSAPGAEDGTYWAAGALAICEEAARANLEGLPNIFFYRGWIPDRFAEVADRRFAFVHIDVDLYQPTLDSLRFFYERTSSRGMILCDDYGFTTCPGARQAMHEFLADKPEEIVHLPTGQGLIIRV